MENQLNRIVWVDWVKALSIFFVVVGHVGTESLRPFVYAFHVPAFFVISGYLYKKAWWLQTFLCFAVPVLCFSVLWFFLSLTKLHFDFSEAWATNTWFVYKLDDTRPMFTGLWFLEVLFVGRLLLGDCGFDFIKKNYKVFSLLAIVFSVLIDVLSIELNWYISRIIQCFPFLGLGLYLKEKNMYNIDPRSKVVMSIAAVGSILFVILVNVNQWCDIMYNRYNSSFIVFFINAVIGSLLLIYLCQFFSRSSVIEVFSIGTLVVLGCHIRAESIFTKILHKFYENEVLDGFISPIISMITSYFIIIVCKKYSPFLLGKIKLYKK